MTGAALLPLLLLGGLWGHAAFWIALNNRIHATGLSRRSVKRAGAAIYLILALGGVWLGLGLLFALFAWPALVATSNSWSVAYAACGSAFALVHFPHWLWQRISRRTPAALRSQSEVQVDTVARLGRRAVAGWKTLLAVQIPGNQLLKFTVSEKTLAIAGLPPALAGFSLAHVSDLHFSGRVERGYFDVVVDELNAMRADLIAVTGDICDVPRCLDWIVPTLGRLASPLGKYFILGNHDLRVDVGQLRRTLSESGLVDVAQSARTLDVRGHQILLAGNERPWFKALPALPAPNNFDLRILLSHTPDQLPWARANHFDLMLAGHAHGGQICWPVTGPMMCPSRYGVKYASGTFHEGPTVMHVSRGASSLARVRFNCPPEITKLVLVPA